MLNRTPNRPGSTRLGVALALLMTALASTASAQTPAAPAAPPAPPAQPLQAAPPPPPPGASPWGAVPYSPPQGQPGDAWTGAPAAAMGQPPGARLIYVEMHSDDPHARIDRVVDGSKLPACVTPCRKWLRTDEVYVIEGDGVRSTSKFQLPDDRNAVTLDVEAGSSARLGGGAALMLGGGIVGYIGIFVVEAGAVSNINGNGDGNNAIRVGGVMLVGGAVALIAGLYMVVTTSTKVTSSTGSTFTREETRPAPRRKWIALTPRGLEF